MRLLDIETQELHEYIGTQCPPYAILSHRWGSAADELTFEEVFERRIDQSKRGYQKLIGACRTTKSYDLRYLWIDTCCIDKRSSAELSEAINSMFRWYSDAQICLTFLVDITSTSIAEIQGSDWFTRAWTLQELIAPRELAFFNEAWEFIGTKRDGAPLIEKITGIPRRVFLEADCLWQMEVDEKMTWAAGRQATRTEDMAYSLMGLFDINLPLLYGEGDRAFQRLQEEIIRLATTPTFLNWGLNQATHKLLAAAPADFFRAKGKKLSGHRYMTFSMSNLGLRLKVELIRCGLGVYGMILGRCTALHNNHQAVLLLKRRRWDPDDLLYKAGVVHVADADYRWSETREITIMRGTRGQYIEKEPGHGDYESAFRPYSLQVQGVKSVILRTHSRAANAPRESEASWDLIDENNNSATACFYKPTLPENSRMICHLSRNCTLWLTFGFDLDSKPCFVIQIQTYEERMTIAPTTTTVQQISTIYTRSPAPDGVHLSFDSYYARVRNTQEKTIFPAWFVRGVEGRSLTAELSPQQLPIDKPIWLYLCPDSYAQNSSNWLLKILDEAPEEINLLNEL